MSLSSERLAAMAAGFLAAAVLAVLYAPVVIGALFSVIEVTRNGIDIVETRVIEDSKTIKRLEGAADAVLLDVPCSGLGVLRRNPDTKWKITPEDLDRLTTLQAEILAGYSRMVKPGGRLVYATCSLLKRENGDQVQAFLKANEGKWVLESEKTHRPDVEGFDGFFAAKLRRVPASHSGGGA